jgi:hypothetical protein
MTTRRAFLTLIVGAIVPRHRRRPGRWQPDLKTVSLEEFSALLARPTGARVPRLWTFGGHPVTLPA